MEAPPKSTRKPRFFSEQELTKIFESAKLPYNDIFKFLYLTGLRTGEISNLEWRDWDKENDLLTIRVVSQDKANRIPGNKTKREETIPLNTDAVGLLEKQEEITGNNTFVFLNELGNRIDNDNIYRSLERILKRQKIRNASPHTFRHTFASHLVIRGVSLYVVRDLMRHKSIRETEIYAHLSQDATRKAAELLSAKKLLLDEPKERKSRGKRHF